MGTCSGSKSSGRGNAKIEQGQQDVINRLNKKISVGSNVPAHFAGGILLEPIKYTPLADGTIEYKAKTMILDSGVESATIGVGNTPPRVRIYETTGKILRDANVNNMRNSYTRLNWKTLVDKVLTKKEYKEYEERLRKLKAR